MSDEISFFSKTRLLFVGESIHGVSEFTLFKQEIAGSYFFENSILVFEADCAGMQLSNVEHDPAYLRLNNFPKVMRTTETLQLLSWAIDRQIPCLGIDCIPRRDLADFSRLLQPLRKKQISENNMMKKRLGSYFVWRDSQMANNLLKIVNDYPESRILVMLHNLHIKKKGSMENSELSLRSVREIIEKALPGQSCSIAQFARGGQALHNDLTVFNFHIDDPFAIETYPFISQSKSVLTFQIPKDRVGWHHAFEQETIPVCEQYEGCKVFTSVHPPSLIN